MFFLTNRGPSALCQEMCHEMCQEMCHKISKRCHKMCQEMCHDFHQDLRLISKQMHSQDSWI